MRRPTAQLRRLRLPLLFASGVFLIMLVAMLLVSSATLLLHHLGLLQGPVEAAPFLLFILASLIIGTILSVLLSHRPLAPIRAMMDAVDRIADGDYSVRLHLHGPEAVQKLGEKFNHMAQELGSVELLRSDFVNNFSHEFKTPIVSIRGFAKALKWEDLSPEERMDYLNIIIEESERLSDLAANVLNLSRVEQQTILTDKTRCNLSEQIRQAIVLLDSKWSDKPMVFVFDSGEVFFTGNEELLKQVWINLLDNAIKFSPQESVITITAQPTGAAVTVTITDQGPGIPEEASTRIFDKFYQGDLSHAIQGNGLGLSLVKRITELHGGTVTLTSVPGQGASFTVTLPTES